nr:MAG TPA: hypothetical protein [Caudoviricetes sp.]
MIRNVCNDFTSTAIRVINTGVDKTKETKLWKKKHF